MSWMKPWPSWVPSRLACGTRSPSKNSSVVSWPFWPIFLSSLPRSKPGVSSATSATTRDTPLAPWVGSVLTAMISRSQLRPLEMNVLAPVMT